MSSQPVMSLDQRIRSAQTSKAARTQVLGPTALSPDETLGQMHKLLRCLTSLLEQNLGALDDEQVWLPFAFNVPAGAQVIVSALVDQDSIFYYRGYGAPRISGVSFIEVIDGVQGAEHFVPPSQPNDVSGWQYGLKGKRAQTRVDLVISNANATAITMDGWFLGRYRKGGR